MHIDEVRRMQAEKDHLMKNEGTHPANRLPDRGQYHGIDYNSHGVELQ